MKNGPTDAELREIALDMLHVAKAAAAVARGTASESAELQLRWAVHRIRRVGPPADDFLCLENWR
jgi:hypothetical protein